MAPSGDHKQPGAYAVSSESTGKPTYFAVTVPAGVEPGATFPFTAGDRRGLTVRLPRNCKAGDVLEVAISPEPQTHYTPLKMAALTTMAEKPHGGAKPMTPELRKSNQEFLEEMADTFVVTIPCGVEPGQKFIAQTPQGDRFLVTCPPTTKPGDQIRIHAPPRDIEDATNSNTKIFQIKAPEGVQPNQVLPVLVCGKRIPITLPANVVPGQILNLKLPVDQVIGSIELSYDDKGSKGWCRTIRITDFKFQWVHQDESPSKFSLGKAAFCRKLTFLEGNDPRLRTGTLELMPAQEVVADSELRHHQRTLVSYATVADVQTKSFEAKHNWFQGICSELTSLWESGSIRLVVRRDHLLSDSIRAVMALSRADMRKRWRIEFFGEPAIDAGGVMREFFQMISNFMFNPDMGLWLPSVNNQTCMRINPASDISCPDDHLIYFRFLGRILGRALFDRQLIDGHMVRYLYKHILGWPITFDDLREQDEEYFQSLRHFTTMSEEEISSLCLDFTLAEETLGVRRDIELVEGGRDIEVTKNNLPEYLEAILKYRTLDRTKPQITELLLGFYDVIPEPALTVFDPNELELILCGLPTIDIDDWEANTIYSGNCSVDNDVVRWLWEIVRNDFDQEMRARLLQFVTGTSGVPSHGFSVLQGNDGNIKKFSIHGVDRKTYVYPRAHTCFNRIDLPNYSTKEELLEKLKTAVTFSAVGFDIE